MPLARASTWRTREIEATLHRGPRVVRFDGVEIEFDPLCPLEEAIEAYGDLKVPKEMWIMENQYHPLWGIPNLGGMDCHDYVMDWLQGLFSGKRVPKKAGRIAYVGEQGDGPWSACDWEPTVKAGPAYF